MQTSHKVSWDLERKKEKEHLCLKVAQQRSVNNKKNRVSKVMNGHRHTKSENHSLFPF